MGVEEAKLSLSVLVLMGRRKLWEWHKGWKGTGRDVDKPSAAVKEDVDDSEVDEDEADELPEEEDEEDEEEEVDKLFEEGVLDDAEGEGVSVLTAGLI